MSSKKEPSTRKCRASLAAFCLVVMPLGFVSPAVAPAAWANDVSQSEIVDKLAPKKPATRSLTRSFGPKKSAISQDDQGYLGSLGQTRGIKFTVKKEATASGYKTPIYETKDIAKIDEIVTKYELPKLEFVINFDFGSAEVSVESIPQVIELAKALNHPSLKETRVILGGHTDAKGSDEFNQSLSQERSNSVARLIAQIGNIAENRLVPIGFGEHKLKNPSDPEAAENRRVEVINISSY